MNKKTEPVIIAEADSTEFNNWLLPEINARNHVITVEKYGAGGRYRQVDQTRKQQMLAAAKASSAKAASAKKTGSGSAAGEAAGRQGDARRAGEIVEDVDAGSVTMQPFTADQLQALTEAAEQEGRDKGYQEGLAQGTEEGRELGFAEGKRLGAEAAQQEASALLAQQLDNLQQIAMQLIEPIETQTAELEQTLLSMVKALTRQMIGRELMLDSGDILAVIQSALAALPVGAGQITLTLNPDDLALVEAHAQENRLDWQFAGDPKMLPGGCRVTTRESLVDYRVETRIDAMLEQFITHQLGNGDTQVVGDGETPLSATATGAADHD